MISLFLDTKHVIYGTISIKLSMDICPNDVLEFEIANSYSIIKSMGSFKGIIKDNSYLQFNLNPYIGDDLEFRMIFRSINNSSDCLGAGGISVSKFEVLSS